MHALYAITGQRTGTVVWLQSGYTLGTKYRWWPWRDLHGTKAAGSATTSDAVTLQCSNDFPCLVTTRGFYHDRCAENLTHCAAAFSGNSQTLVKVCLAVRSRVWLAAEDDTVSEFLPLRACLWCLFPDLLASVCWQQTEDLTRIIHVGPSISFPYLGTLSTLCRF